MTGTPSRTATASLRGEVGKKLWAKPWPEEHESHKRRPLGGRVCSVIQSPMSSGPAVVDAAGIWGEGHAPYPGRSAYLLERAREAGRRTMGRQESAEAKVAVAHDGERAEREKPNRHEAFDA